MSNKRSIGGCILGKIKDLFNGEHGTFFKFLAFNLAVFMFVWIVGPGNTVVHWARSKAEQRHQKQQMEYYRQEIEQMRRKVTVLKNDRDTLEKFAREQFYFSAPGEDVYVMDKE